MKININLQAVYQDDYLKVGIDQTVKFIFVEWFRHPSSQDFRSIFQKLADITIETRSEYWLSDARAIHYLEFADQNWLLREMAPLLKKSYLKKFARLTTKESLLLLDVIRVYDMVNQWTELGIETKLEMFTNKEDAINWLFSDFEVPVGGDR
jgi:hypothetical protein